MLSKSLASIGTRLVVANVRTLVEGSGVQLQTKAYMRRLHQMLSELLRDLHRFFRALYHVRQGGCMNTHGSLSFFVTCSLVQWHRARFCSRF